MGPTGETGPTGPAGETGPTGSEASEGTGLVTVTDGVIDPIATSVSAPAAQLLADGTLPAASVVDAASGALLVGAGAGLSMTQLALGAANRVLSTGSSGAMGWRRRPHVDPGDRHFLFETISADDFANASNISAAGQLRVVAGKMIETRVVTNVRGHVVTAASGLVVGQSKIALYVNVAGALTLLAQTGDCKTQFETTGTFTAPLTTPTSVPEGWVVCALWSNGSSGPDLARGASSNNGIINIGLTPIEYIAGQANSGITTTPPATLGPISQALTAVRYYLAFD